MVTVTLQDVSETDLEFYEEDSKFSTPLDDSREPTESELKALDFVEKFLPAQSVFVFRCRHCGSYHDMLKLRGDGEGNLICPKTGKSC